MPRPPSIQWYYKQYLGDNKVLAMDWDARGMHVHLLMLSVQEEPPGTIPADDAAIRRWLSLPLGSVDSDQTWRRVKSQLLAAWQPEGDRLVNSGMREACNRQARYRDRYEIGTKKPPNHNEEEDSNALEVYVGSKKEKVQACRIPESFIPKDEHYSIASDLGINCEMEFQKFRDYFLGVSGAKGVKRDWDATLRNWLRNSINFGGRSSGREPTKAEQRVINSRRNIRIALGDLSPTGASGPGVSVGDPTGPDEGLAGLLQGRKG